MRRGIRFFFILLGILGVVAPCRVLVAGVSLVPASEAVSDEEARLALARLLSWNDASLDEAARQYRILLAEKPDRADARLELARVLMRQKRFDEALRELETLIARQPQNEEALLEAGRIHLWQKRYDEALGFFNRLRRGGDAPPAVELETARALSWSGRFAEAAASYRKALSGRELTGELSAEFADALLYGGSPKEAVDYYQRAVRAGLSPPALRKRLAEALERSGRRQEALPIWEELGAELPKDRQVQKRRAGIHLETGDYEKAGRILQALLAEDGTDREALEALAETEAALGHAKACRELYLKALALAPDDEGLLLRYAGRMLSWGDFYGAEGIYRGLLAKGKDSPDLVLKLAGVLASAERYEEAEGLYLRLLWEGRLRREALSGLTGVKLQEKKFGAALVFADELIRQDPGDLEARRLKGEALLGDGRHAEALAVYEGLRRESHHSAIWPIEIGKIHLKLGEKKRAGEFFAEAGNREPASLEALFYRRGPDQAPLNLTELLGAAGRSPAGLVALAGLYDRHGYYEPAIECYRRALAMDGAYFPAQLGLAQTLAFARRYDESIALHRRLLEDLPGVSKLMIGLARVLGWSGNYDASLALYEEVRRLNPRDPVVAREKARVALWGKRFPLAMAEYDRLLFPPWQEIITKAPHLSPGLKGALLAALTGMPEDGLLPGDLKGQLGGLSDAAAAEAERVLFEALTASRVQRILGLEKEAKASLWDRRHRRGLRAYEELLQASPGNEEALFDLAQVQCTLGLCDEERATYERLLAVDPLHFLAREALAQNEARQRPGLALEGAYWREDGRGQLSQIERRRTDAVAEIPLAGRHRLRLAGHDWRETPTFTGRSYEARGYSLAWEGVASAYLRGEAGWRHKSYADGSFSDLDEGWGRLWISAADWLEIGAGLERSEEIPNYFAMEQGIRTDARWVSAASHPVRGLEIKGVLRRLDYSDRNRGYYHSLSVGYDLTDHPRQLKFIVTGEYRDTKREFFVDGSGGMVHPYWTPRQYSAGTLTAVWRHDLAAPYLCGGRRHFYELRFSLGTDSTGNGAFRLEGEWRLELAEHWGLAVAGLVHRSAEWDAEALQARLEYRF